VNFLQGLLADRCGFAHTLRGAKAPSQASHHSDQCLVDREVRRVRASLGRVRRGFHGDLIVNSCYKFQCSVRVFPCSPRLLRASKRYRRSAWRGREPSTGSSRGGIVHRRDVRRWATSGISRAIFPNLRRRRCRLFGLPFEAVVKPKSNERRCQLLLLSYRFIVDSNSVIASTEDERCGVCIASRLHTRLREVHGDAQRESLGRLEDTRRIFTSERRRCPRWRIDPRQSAGNGQATRDPQAARPVTLF